MPRCAGLKPDSSQCERIVDGRSTYCYSHDPTKKEVRRRAASKAGKSKTPAGELRDVKAALRQLADDVLERRVDRADGSVAAQVLGVYLRAIEAERRVRETEELAARLDALEQQTSPTKAAAWHR